MVYMQNESIIYKWSEEKWSQFYKKRGNITKSDITFVNIEEEGNELDTRIPWILLLPIPRKARKTTTTRNIRSAILCCSQGIDNFNLIVFLFFSSLLIFPILYTSSFLSYQHCRKGGLPGKENRVRSFVWELLMKGES